MTHQVRGNIETVNSPRQGPGSDGKQAVNADGATGLQLSSVLLSGHPKSGKTALAAHLVKEANFPFVRFLSAQNFIGMGELSKMNYVNKVLIFSFLFYFLKTRSRSRSWK